MGWLIVLGSIFPIWVGYMARFKGRTEVIRIRQPDKIRDQKGYALFMGENLMILGVVAAIIGVFMELKLNQGFLGMVPTALIVVSMLRIIKGGKEFY